MRSHMGCPCNARLRFCCLRYIGRARNWQVNHREMIFNRSRIGTRYFVRLSDMDFLFRGREPSLHSSRLASSNPWAFAISAEFSTYRCESWGRAYTVGPRERAKSRAPIDRFDARQCDHSAGSSTGFASAELEPLCAAERSNASMELA